MLKSRKTLLWLLGGSWAIAFVAIATLIFVLSSSTVSAAPAEQAKTLPPAAQAKVDDYNQLLTQFRQNFASKLGVDAAKLDSAFAGAVSDTVGQMVKDGKISQAQADTIKAFTKDGLKGFSFPFSSTVTDQLAKSMPFNLDQLKAAEAKVATSLNLTTDQLEAQVKSGKSLAEIATAQKVDIKVVKDSIQSAVTDTLTQSVKDGKLTQAQADQVTKFLPMVLDKLVNAKAGAGMFGSK